jgi:RND family efflux transporter MFP subunit
VRGPFLALSLLLAFSPAAAQTSAPADTAGPQAPADPVVSSAASAPELTRGIVRARDEAWLSSDLSLPIDQLPFKEGDHFRKGQVVISFDCATLQAQLKAATAKLQGEAITLKNNRQLKQHNAIGQYEVDLAEAKVNVAQAEHDAIAVSLDRCDIPAPFDGQVGQMGVHLHETPDRNARIMQLLSSSDLEVDMILPSSWLRWLKPGTPFSLTLDELGETANGEVIRMAAAVDAVSQTVKVVGRLTGDLSRIRPGMSGVTAFKDQP